MNSTAPSSDDRQSAASATATTTLWPSAIDGLYKAQVIHRRGPWRSFEAVEYATLEWVDWFNHRRLPEPSATSRLPKPKINIMLPRTTSIGQRESQPNASDKPGAVQFDHALII